MDSNGAIEIVYPNNNNNIIIIIIIKEKKTKERKRGESVGEGDRDVGGENLF